MNLQPAVYGSMEEGYQGITRFGMFDIEMMLVIGFGESSIYPSYFNGPEEIWDWVAALYLVAGKESLKKVT